MKQSVIICKSPTSADYGCAKLGKIGQDLTKIGENVQSWASSNKSKKITFASILFLPSNVITECLMK